MRPLFLFAIYGVAFAGVTLVRAAADANNPAHELAQKFAIGDQLKTNADPLPIQPQPKPVVTAPQPAVVAPKVQLRAQPPAPAAPTAAAPPAKAAPKLAQAKPRPPAPGPDYERDMLDAARAEAESRQKIQSQSAETKPAVATPTTAAVTAPAVQPPASPPPVAATTEAATPQPTVPAPTPAPQIKIEAKISVPAPSAPAIVSRPDGAPRATVLTVLTHPAHDARAITPPDPIICLADICYVSAGLNADAKIITRADALSTKNTVTSGAGACKGVSRCAFRGVSMKPGDEVQIIDLGLVGHDWREPADVLPDNSCHVDDGDLVCEHPVTAPDYRIWVVPEAVAASAGPGALEAALADDLPEEDIARTEDK